jgi:hypothetical protein
MKIKNVLAVLLAVLLLAGILTGCASKMSTDVALNGNHVYSESGSGIYDGAEKKEEMGISSSSDTQLADRKLIKTVELNTETEEMDMLIAAINTQVSELGGYIENQRVYNGSAYASRRSRSASMTIRIPAERLDDFVNHVAENTNIVSRYDYIDDVTLTYVATESRVAALKTEETRLLELMAQAETMSDLLQVEARLTDVRYELEQVTSQLNVLKNQVSYGTIHLAIDEVKEYTPVEEETFWQRISGGFVDSLKDIGDGIVELTVFVLANLPYLVILGAVAAAVIVLGKRHIRKKKSQKKEDKQA